MFMQEKADKDEPSESNLKVHLESVSEMDVEDEYSNSEISSKSSKLNQKLGEELSAVNATADPDLIEKDIEDLER
jgi:hypothetical protein